MRGAATAAALAAALLASPALAYCEDAGSSMVELKTCLAEVETRIETELAIAWAEAQRNIAGRDFMEPVTLARYAAAADRAQAAWAAWRLADCREVTGFDWWGGSGAGAAIRACMIETAAARIRDLAARYQLNAQDYPLAHQPR